MERDRCQGSLQSPQIRKRSSSPENESQGQVIHNQHSSNLINPQQPAPMSKNYPASLTRIPSSAQPVAFPHAFTRSSYHAVLPVPSIDPLGTAQEDQTRHTSIYATTPSPIRSHGSVMQPELHSLPVSEPWLPLLTGQRQAGAHYVNPSRGYSSSNLIEVGDSTSTSDQPEQGQVLPAQLTKDIDERCLDSECPAFADGNCDFGVVPVIGLPCRESSITKSLWDSEADIRKLRT